MIHPDYQYDARVIPHAVGMIELGICDVVLGNRVRSRAEALDVRHAVVEVHQQPRPDRVRELRPSARTSASSTAGFRVYRREVLETIPFERN